MVGDSGVRIMALERSWPAVAPQLLTADGGTLGQIQITNTKGFKVKARAVVSQVGNPDTIVEIKRVLSATVLLVGAPGMPITDRSVDLSSYTVLGGAFIYAEEQGKNNISVEDRMCAVYDQEPTVAIRSVLVDHLGRYYDVSNPLPTSGGGGGGGGGDGSILDGVDPSIRATVTAGSALKVDNSAVTQPISAVSLPLPAGAATSAKQDTANTSLASINTKTPALGQAVKASSVPVTIASDQDPIPVIATIDTTGLATEAKQDVSNTSLSSINTKLNSQATAAKQDTGNTSLASIDTKLSSQATATKQDTSNSSLSSIDTKLDALATEASLASLNSKVTAVNTGAVTIFASALPTGAATSALQTTGNNSLSSIDTKLSSQATATKQDTGNGSLASIDTKTPALGQAVMSASSPVVIASNQSPIPVTGSFSITGVATEATLAALNSKVTTVDTGAVTIFASALPTGAATSALQTVGNGSLSSIDTKLSSQATAAKQDTGNASLASIDTKLTSQATAAKQDTGNGSLASIDTKLTSQATASKQDTGNASLASIDTKIDSLATQATLASLNSKVTAVDTGAVTIFASALPTGAATSALQTTGNTSLANIDGKTPSLGQAAMAASVPVVIASNQSAIPTTVSGVSTAANQTTEIASLASIDTKLTSQATGTKQDTGNTSLASIDSKIKQVLTPASPTTFTAGVASAQAVAANSSRKGLVIINRSTNTVSFGLGAPAVLNSGITLTPNGIWVMDAYTYCTTAINAIASSASSVLAIQEFS
jgi:hypothetical protein